MVEQTMKQITDIAEEIKNNAPADVALEIGDVLRQGDLYVVRVHSLPQQRRRRGNRQLADGDTQGSRHVLRGKCGLFDVDSEDVAGLLRKADRRFEVRDYQVGPAFETAGPATIEHPEHGHRTLSEPGCYLTVFQRSLTVDEREERARD